MDIANLGAARYPSPLKRWVSDSERVPATIVRSVDTRPADDLLFELAGAREHLFFDPPETRAGIVTCGGLCPGLNDVIRSLFFEMHHAYGVKEVLGFRWGYQGLDPDHGAEPLVLTPELVDAIHLRGGTILGTSRGPVDTGRAVDNLISRRINILFSIGGDGTQRGAREFFQEAQRRGYALSVVGIPKTIDNDIPFVSRSFGFLTAVSEAAEILQRAHTEARSVQNGIALVKLMGRHAGFLTAAATLASQDVNFTLIPEVPFRLEGEKGFLAALEKRMVQRGHAVIAVAEGSGQELLGDSGDQRDASGNIRLSDIGLFLSHKIEEWFSARRVPFVMRYFDPSYIVRSSPDDAEDAVLCDRFARYAVHAAMAGKPGLVIGLLHDYFIHVPIELLATQQKRLDPESPTWSAVLAATGQPHRFE
ncbi:MAG TPA: ATP-dependent 6-phosphofructokinase [Candidatus Acidoferrales bacterium]|nr:ATP-dependent 6-phosphofructokinase [Candidatus Acidoferrales bacterium]